MNGARQGSRERAVEAADSDFRRDVLSGLASTPRWIPPKYFYDQAGSQLFESICTQPEYYPTVTESRLLDQQAETIADSVGRGRVLIEPGCGNCEKVRTLLAALRPAVYVPIDISCDQLHAAAAGVAEDFPWLAVHPLCTDITSRIMLPAVAQHGRRLLFYPGSSIGNFEPDDAVCFLRDLAGLAGAGGSLLVGVDLQKDDALLEAAYNDERGVTARFNLNLLERINRELDADFDIAAFDHLAFYNRVKERIEMHLVSRRRQTVRVAGNLFEFRSGDTIHTENSYKYTEQGFVSMAARAGFRADGCWKDENGLFSLQLLGVAEK